MISVGLFVSSFMTALTGIARTYATVFVARMGTGVDEAALSPPTYSLLADYFPKEKLARAIFGGQLQVNAAFHYIDWLVL